MISSCLSCFNCFRSHEEEQRLLTEDQDVDVQPESSPSLTSEGSSLDSAEEISSLSSEYSSTSLDTVSLSDSISDYEE